MKRPAIALVVAATIGAMHAQEAREPSPSRAALLAEITDLKKRLNELSDRVSELSSSSVDLWADVENHKHDTATFDPYSPGGFDRLDTSVGVLLVSLVKVAPYMSGYQIQLDIGNTTTATVNGFSLAATWNSKYVANKSGAYVDWAKRRHNKEFQFVDDLTPGRWTRVELFLPDTQAADFEWMSIGASFTSVSLRRPTVQ